MDILGDEEMVVGDDSGGGSDGEDGGSVQSQLDLVDDGSAQTAETNRFDAIVGALEDFLIDDGFEAARVAFCRQQCGHFEEGEENKLIYTQLFAQYQTLIESAIETR